MLCNNFLRVNRGMRVGVKKHEVRKKVQYRRKLSISRLGE
jgi:hypothetical protein